MHKGRAAAAVLCGLVLWTGVAAAQERKGQTSRNQRRPPDASISS